MLNPDCGYAAAVWKDATVWSTNHVRRNKKLATKSTGRIMKAKEVRPHVTELAGCPVKLTKGTVDAFQIGAVGIVNGIMNELARSANPAKRKPDDVVSAARVVLGVDTYNRLMSPVPYRVRFTVKPPDGVPAELPVGTPVYVPMGMDETDDQDPEVEAEEAQETEAA